MKKKSTDKTKQYDKNPQTDKTAGQSLNAIKVLEEILESLRITKTTY